MKNVCGKTCLHFPADGEEIQLKDAEGCTSSSKKAFRQSIVYGERFPGRYALIGEPCFYYDPLKSEVGEEEKVERVSGLLQPISSYEGQRERCLRYYTELINKPNLTEVEAAWKRLWKALRENEHSHEQTIEEAIKVLYGMYALQQKTLPSAGREEKLEI